MRLLALVPARGGSKRIPDKNIRVLGDKPLIHWTIDTARQAAVFVDVLVSTDSPAIAEVARARGALVPWLRPAELATDTATSMGVCLHALDWYEATHGTVDGLMLLQPTSPFRSAATIRRGVDLFRGHAAGSVVAFSPAASHPYWCYRIQGNSLQPFMDGVVMPTRSQDLPPAHVINGALYVAGPSYLRRHGSFLGPQAVPLVMDDAREALDIDTEMDWAVAEALLQRQA